MSIVRDNLMNSAPAIFRTAARSVLEQAGFNVDRFR
jgi:hypothetical protein